MIDKLRESLTNAVADKITKEVMKYALSRLSEEAVLNGLSTAEAADALQVMVHKDLKEKEAVKIFKELGT